MSRRLFVCSLRHVPAMLERHRPSHLLTLLGPTGVLETPAGFAAGRHRRVTFNDIVAPRHGFIVPDAAHVAEILAFADEADETAPLLVHCWAGISRSTAAAYMIACARHPDVAEEAVAAALRSAAPEATPNARLVELADQLLGRDGRMVAAIAAIGRGREAGEGEPFELAL